jgi:DNA-binding transcriptional regulator YiaG
VTAGDTLADEQLGAIFGIDLDAETDAHPVPPPPPPPQPRATRRVATTKTRQPARAVQARTIVPAAPPAGRSRPSTRRGTHREPSPQPATTTRRVAAKVATGASSTMHPTGTSVARLRRKQGLSVAQFAAQLGVSPATVYRWEAAQGPLNLQPRLLHTLTALQQRAKKGVV